MHSHGQIQHLCIKASPIAPYDVVAYNFYVSVPGKKGFRMCTLSTRSYINREPISYSELMLSDHDPLEEIGRVMQFNAYTAF